VVASQFERVFSWAKQMHRLEWEEHTDGDLCVWMPGCGFSFSIHFDRESSNWVLVTVKNPHSGWPERTEHRYRYLQDAMAAAELQTAVGR
jgi:hypothetical protein